MKQPKPKKIMAERGSKSGDKKPEPFDIWLNRGLHRIYDDVASEPIPDALLKLIEDDRKK